MVVLASGSFLAASEHVDVDVKWAGVRNIIMREGATMLRVSGEGLLLACTYGALVQHTLAPGQSVIVDTGHVVGYDDTCAMRVGPLGGVARGALNGEGFVAKFTGPGRVWIQTRTEV